MSDDLKWQRRLARERAARKEAELLLEAKSLELWHLNQDLENKVISRTEELEQALADAERANRAKDEFLSNMSHEIRTPLNAIIGFVDILLLQPIDTTRRNKYLGIIKQSGKNLLLIINDILDFSKIQSGKFSINPEPAPIRDVVTNTCALFRSKAEEKNIAYELLFDSDIPECLNVDDTRLTQIINNFISNAIKFTDQGSIRILVTYDTNTQTLDLRVVDTGTGIALEQQQKIFSPFEQENKSITKSHGGTGLGLSISLSLIELMHGRLIFESLPGKGSTFGFAIPLTPCVLKQEEANLPQTPRMEGHVLVIKANKVNRLLLSLMLESFGLTYHGVDSEEEIWQALREERFHAVLIDLEMPDRSGIKLATDIRCEYQEILIIGLVGDSGLPNEAKKSVDNALSKPVDVEKLEALLLPYLKAD